MSVQVRRRREAAAFLSTFVGAQGELLVDTTNNRLQVHDGATPGGWPAAKLAEIWREQTDQLTVSALNTVATKLSRQFDGRKITISIVGYSFTNKGVNPAFTVGADGTITWSANNSGVNLEAGDQPLATYTYVYTGS